VFFMYVRGLVRMRKSCTRCSSLGSKVLPCTSGRRPAGDAVSDEGSQCCISCMSTLLFLVVLSRLHHRESRLFRSSRLPFSECQLHEQTSRSVKPALCQNAAALSHKNDYISQVHYVNMVHVDSVPTLSSLDDFLDQQVV
jgi:hypothetical protein